MGLSPLEIAMRSVDSRPPRKGAATHSFKARGPCQAATVHPPRHHALVPRWLIEDAPEHLDLAEDEVGKYPLWVRLVLAVGAAGAPWVLMIYLARFWLQHFLRR
jgi:hypothetical protein